MVGRYRARVGYLVIPHYPRHAAPWCRAEACAAEEGEKTRRDGDRNHSFPPTLRRAPAGDDCDYRWWGKGRCAFRQVRVRAKDTLLQKLDPWVVRKRLYAQEVADKVDGADGCPNACPAFRFIGDLGAELEGKPVVSHHPL